MAMRRQSSPKIGRVAWLSDQEHDVDRSCEQLVFERALADLHGAASRDQRVQAKCRELEDVIHELRGSVQARQTHTSIHGELGPDHILLDGDGDPVLIDIEGAMFFDREWEHAFLQLRFSPQHYLQLGVDGLDTARIAFYTLATRLSLVTGPLRLLETGFPERKVMQEIVEHQIQQTLAYLEERRRST